MLDVNIVNSFLAATIETISVAAGLNLNPGKPYVRNLFFTEECLRIILGITGEMQGQVIISIPNEKAMQIASQMMMGMPVNSFDEMSLSALSELGNMIMGHTATNLSTHNILVDITPPIVERGTVLMDSKELKNLCIPFLSEGNMALEVNIMVKA